MEYKNSVERNLARDSGQVEDSAIEAEPSEFENFEHLTRKLVQTPKPEVDEKRSGS